MDSLIRPKITILNNIEFDHADYYRDIDDLKSAFNEFVDNLPHDGFLICNGDDTNIKDLKSEINIQDISCIDNRQNPSKRRQRWQNIVR